MSDKKNKSMIMKSFNTHFFDFLQDIINIFPENQDIQYAKTSFESFKQMNPSIIIKVWFSYVYTPYVKIIDDGDISFFFDKNYENDLSILSKSKEIMGMIDKLREPVRRMSDLSKTHSMKYIQNLSKLSTLYDGM